MILVFRCECDKGYTGKNCESYYYPCDPSPCDNGGRCSEVGKYDYKCSCPAGKTDGLLVVRVVTSCRRVLAKLCRFVARRCIVVISQNRPKKNAMNE